jgi:hypothetical protein
MRIENRENIAELSISFRYPHSIIRDQRSAISSGIYFALCLPIGVMHRSTAVFGTLSSETTIPRIIVVAGLGQKEKATVKN